MLYSGFWGTGHSTPDGFAEMVCEELVETGLLKEITGTPKPNDGLHDWRLFSEGDGSSFLACKKCNATWASYPIPYDGCSGTKRI